MYLDGAQGNGKPLAAQLMSPGGSSASEDCFIFYYNLDVSLPLSPGQPSNWQIFRETAASSP